MVTAMASYCAIITMFTYLGGVLAGGLVLIYVYFWYCFTYWKRRGLPHLTPSFPFGNMSGALLMRKQMGLLFKDIYDAFQGHKCCGFYQMHQPVLMIRDLDLLKDVLIKDFRDFHDRGIHHDEKSDPLMAHLFIINGQKWRRIRSGMTPMFTSGRIKLMLPIVKESAETLRGVLQGQLGVVEVSDLMARATTDVIAMCAFGIQGNCLVDPDAEFRRMGKQFFDRGLTANLGLISIFLVPSVARVFRMGATPKHVAKFFFRIIRESVDYREKNNIVRDDFLSRLIQLKNGTDEERNTNDHSGGKKPFTVEEMTAQAFILYLAGYETSATTMSFCLYELAVHPDIQTRVRHEVRTVLRRYGGKFEFEALKEMVYLDMVLTETMRMYPAVPQLNRICTRKYRVPDSDLVVEPNTLVVVPVYAILRDAQNYPNPDRFDPERFNPELKDTRSPLSNIVFGEGPRVCIGKMFAMMVMKTMMVTLLSNFEFGVCEKTVVPLVISPRSFLLTVEGGIHLSVRQIQDDNLTT